MFDFIKKMWTETNHSTHSNIAPINLPVTYSCGHEGQRRSMYFDMVSPSALENYLQFLETTKCAECAAVERATEKVSEKAHDTSRIAGRIDEIELRPAA